MTRHALSLGDALSCQVELDIVFKQRTATTGAVTGRYRLGHHTRFVPGATTLALWRQEPRSPDVMLHGGSLFVGEECTLDGRDDARAEIVRRWQAHLRRG